MTQKHTEVAIIGTGIIGISTAYYLAINHGVSNIILIDRDQPMAFTSAQSGENYRNWWPHPAMVDFTNRSIDLMEKISRDSGNRINKNRRGYALATRESNIDALVDQLHQGLGESANQLLRFHEDASSSSYFRPDKPDWEPVPDGVDILRNRELIKSVFPSYAHDIQSVVHIRRGGDISGQQLGMYMLEFLKEAGVRRVIGEVKEIRQGDDFIILLSSPAGNQEIRAAKVINAAGPFADKIAEMLGVDLPVFHTFQQKIAFDDREKAVLRNMPFSIDLDGQNIDWSDEEREMLLEDSEYRWLAEGMPGAIHCRPDGGDNGTWVKLGWAYNASPANPTWEPPLDENFPDIVLRGAALLNPSLKVYYGKLPRSTHHYGGWYTMTDENWPLIGPMGPEGAFMNCALSGYGTMAACAAGELCAAWVADAELPQYAQGFSLARYEDDALMAKLSSSDKGLL
ncbi:MAG: FAD-dependent oxidoreductase [Blastopirellula sp.]|nr:MAG: FAD-dependent oxidoreductase [Blastopirellula sp.]